MVSRPFTHQQCTSKYIIVFGFLSDNADLDLRVKIIARANNALKLSTNSNCDHEKSGFSGAGGLWWNHHITLYVAIFSHSQYVIKYIQKILLDVLNTKSNKRSPERNLKNIVYCGMVVEVPSTTNLSEKFIF